MPIPLAIMALPMLLFATEGREHQQTGQSDKTALNACAENKVTVGEDVFVTTACPIELFDKDGTWEYDGPRRAGTYIESAAVKGGSDYRLQFTKLSPNPSGVVSDHYRKRLASTAKRNGGVVHEAQNAEFPVNWPFGPKSDPSVIPPAFPSAWWASSSSPSTMAWVQNPEKLSPCNNSWASGTAVVTQGDAVFVFSWRIQHYFPMGGCGG